MDLTALIVSIFAILIAGASAYFAKVQADASRIQAAAATKALNQAASWRAEEERSAEPQFLVNVEPINDLRDGQIAPSGERLFSVHVL